MPADTLEDIKKVIEPIVFAEGMELVDVEYQQGKKRGVLRIYVDREDGGITLKDCTEISKEVGEILEVKELISNSYLLEVSSPGLNRKLRKEEDFIKHKGKLVKIKTFEPVNSQKKFEGRLLLYEKGNIIISVEGKEVCLPFRNIAKANIKYEFA